MVVELNSRTSPELASSEEEDAALKTPARANVIHSQIGSRSFRFFRNAPSLALEEAAGRPGEFADVFFTKLNNIAWR